jgi:hypothetical protein
MIITFLQCDKILSKYSVSRDSLSISESDLKQKSYRTEATERDSERDGRYCGMRT